MSTVSGKKVFITGASSGIGADLAVGLARAGATVGLCARRRDRLDEVLASCREHAPGSQAFPFDLAKLDELPAFILGADDAMGGIDILVNNAGMPKRRRAMALSPQDVEGVMAVNYFSPVRLTVTLLPRMLERGGGRIVNVSSIAAFLSSPGESAYAASKAALTAWSESLSMELSRKPISVHLVYPGIIDTEIFHLPDNDPLPEGVADALPASAVTEAVLAQLESGAVESWIPEQFHDIIRSKSKDLDSYLKMAGDWYAGQWGDT
ncbi:MAG TPA: SDR family NAD(P)-dependent oxidoreductase [Acidimicrobiales bacterium]|nr:SDR family NAD(P)-dependent oxidoreductase [Acidimicrobiales bacterium]